MYEDTDTATTRWKVRGIREKTWNDVINETMRTRVASYMGASLSLTLRLTNSFSDTSESLMRCSQCESS